MSDSKTKVKGTNTDNDSDFNPAMVESSSFDADEVIVEQGDNRQKEKKKE